MADMEDRESRSLVDMDRDQEEDFLDEAAEKIKKTQKNWSTDNDRVLFYPSGPTTDKLDAGLYKCVDVNNIGPALRKLVVSVDDLIEIKDAATQGVIDEVTRFWSDEIRHRYKDHGFLHKRGILMYGDPGSGKTAAIQVLIKDLIDKGGIAIYADHPYLLTSCLQIFRRIEPDRPAIVILEDFETLTDRERRENEWLSVLDGEAQVENVVFLATTNYIEQLDKRFTDRPSRFDLVVPVKPPNAQARATFLVEKAKIKDRETLEKWVRETESLSIAHLKELVVGCCILGQDFNHVLNRIKEMHNRDFSTNDVQDNKEKAIGFGAPISDDREKIDWDKLKERYPDLK